VLRYSLTNLDLKVPNDRFTPVIWLHGLGANGHDFEPIVPELGLPQNSAVKFIFPHAPSIPVTVNGGYVMPAWYDILEMSIERKVDETQLRASAQAIIKFVNKEIDSGIDSKRIILAGFSQGGAVAIEAALSFNQSLGGLLLLSTYFGTKDSIQFAPENKNIPILIHHGDFDPVVPLELSKVSENKLKQEGYQVATKTYPMEHSVCPPQITDIGEWLKICLQLSY